MPAAANANETPDYTVASRCSAEVPNDLSFLVGLRTRIKLHGKGPRALAMVNNSVYAANYFSDSLDIVDLNPNPRVTSIPLVSSSSLVSRIRLGELYFNDAALCFQEWLSCASFL